MTRNEDKIRAFLASNLDVLESGLTLGAKEYSLPNAVGAGGRIDLVARDTCSNFVIIEIKRSDQAARQTLNEVHKYTALFRTVKGLDESSVRIMTPETTDRAMVMVENGLLVRTPFNFETFHSLEEFAEQHAEYLGALRKYLEERSVGLPGASVAASP